MSFAACVADGIKTAAPLKFKKMKVTDNSIPKAPKSEVLKEFRHGIDPTLPTKQWIEGVTPDSLRSTVDKHLQTATKFDGMIQSGALDRRGIRNATLRRDAALAAAEQAQGTLYKYDAAQPAPAAAKPTLRERIFGRRTPAGAARYREADIAALGGGRGAARAGGLLSRLPSAGRIGLGLGGAAVGAMLLSRLLSSPKPAPQQRPMLAYA